MNETCVHNVMHWARCFECEVDMLNIQLSTAETEIARLNKWADGMTDIALKERATSEAYQRELRAKLADAVAFVRKVGHLPECEALTLKCRFRYNDLDPREPPFCNLFDWAHVDKHGGRQFNHDFQPGKCTCGHDELLINAQPSPYLVALERINALLALHGAAALPEITHIVHNALKK